MQQTVYLDVLIFLNTLINFYILFITGLITHSRIIKWRIIAGGLAGGLMSAAVLLPELHEALSLFLKVLATAGIVALSFEPGGRARFLRRFIAFLGINFLFAGAVLFCYFVFKTPLIFYNNGNFYFDIDAPFLIVIATLTYLLLSITVRRSSRPVHIQKYYKLEIYKSKERVRCTALADTGNSLKDVFSGTPVIVADFQAVKKLLPDSYRRFFTQDDTAFEERDDLESMKDIRLIPFSTALGRGFLKAFKCDEILISEDGEQKGYKLCNAYVAVYNGSLSSGNYEAVINPEILDTAREAA